MRTVFECGVKNKIEVEYDKENEIEYGKENQNVKQLLHLDTFMEMSKKIWNTRIKILLKYGQ